MAPAGGQVTLGCLLLQKYDELSKSVAFDQKLMYFTDQNGPKGEPHGNEFWVFSNSEMNVTSSCPVSMFPSWVKVLKLSKKMHFLQFCADLSKKSKSIKAIYIYASERSRYTLSENRIVYYAMTLRFWRY